MARSMLTGGVATTASVFNGEMKPARLASFGETFAAMIDDDSGQALVEYCIIMATLTILMMVAYRNIGTVANAKANNNVTNLTNSSVVAP